MNIVRWQPFSGRNPWGSVNSLQNRMNNLFEDFFRSDDEPDLPSWSPRVDLIELEDKFEITAELPGMSGNDVKLELHDNSLIISGEKTSGYEKKERNLHITERVHGNFRRTFTMPSHADLTKISAGFNNGILTIAIPKREEAKPKQIEIKIQ